MTEKTIFRLRALCFCDQEAQRYPLSLTCTDEALITNSARLMRRMKELEGRLNDRLCCCQVQELPFNQLYSADTSVDEQFYIASSPVELYRYFEHLSNQPEVSRIAGWRYQQGEIVEVLLGDSLTLGIVVDTPLQSASSHYRARQERLKQAKGEEQSEWELRASPCDNRYRVLLYVTPEQLALRQIPAPLLLQPFTLEASEQRELLQKRYAEYGL